VVSDYEQTHSFYIIFAESSPRSTLKPCWAVPLDLTDDQSKDLSDRNTRAVIKSRSNEIYLPISETYSRLNITQRVDTSQRAIDALT